MLLNNQSEDHFSESIINSLPGVFYLYDESGQFLRWNKNFETVTGYSANEVAGMHPLDLFDTDEQELLKAKIANVFRKGSDSVEAHLLTKDKRRIPYYFTGNKLQYQGKNCLVGTGIDISEQQKAKARLAEKIVEAEERAKELNCLYRVSELLGHSDLPEADILQQCTKHVVAGYLHPEHTAVRISVEATDYVSPAFRESSWKQSAEIMSGTSAIGKLEVFYTGDVQGSSPFLPEEQALLDSVADILGTYIERKQAKARQDFERRDKEALINNTDDLIWSIDPEMKLIAANQPFMEAIRRNTGISLAPGDDILLGGALPSEFTRTWEQSYRRALGGETFRETLYTPAGNEVAESWIETSFNPILDGKRVIGAACHARNITERKQFESALLDMNHKLEAAQSIARLGYWELNLETNTLYWSEEVFRIWGVTPESFVVNFENFYNTIHPDDRLEFDRQQKLGLSGQEDLNFEHRILLPGGQIKIVNERGKLVYNNLGKPVRFEGTVQDVTEQKQHESAIQESEEKYRYLFNNNPSVIFIWDLQDFRILEVNDTALDTYGYSREEVLKMSIRELRLPEDGPLISKISSMLLRGEQQSVRRTWRHPKKNGEILHMDITSHRINYGQRPAVLSLAKDITEQVKAEEAIIRSEQRFRETLDKMLEGVQIIGHDWRYLYLNEAAAKHGRFTAGELLGRTMMECFPGIENSSTFRLLELCMTEREIRQHIENKFEFPDGATAWFELSVQPVPEGIFILSIDITERKQAEEEIRNSEEKRRLIMNAALDAIICIDTAGCVTFWNPQAEKIFGWTTADVMGKFLTDIIIPERYKQRHNEGMKRYLSSGQSQMLRRVNEFSGLRADGTEFPIELIVMPVQQGEEHFFCAFIRDITERTSARRELQERNEQLRNLSSYLQTVREEERTHIAREIHDELGQQLTVLKMDVASLRNKLKDALPEIRQKTEDLVGIADHSIQTIRRIITELRPGILDDLGLLAALEWQAKEFGQKTGIPCTFRSALAEDHFPKAINTAVFRIFQESLTNVARHAGATRVDASLEYRDGILLLEIRDNGKGISDTRKNNKTSFGLLGMRERAQMLNGTFDIFAAPEGGTTIHLKIPFTL